MSSLCVYSSITGTAYGFVQALPWVIPTAVTVFSFTRDFQRRWGFEFSPFWYSFYLSFCQLVIYILQMAVHAMRPDPFCGNVLMTAAFPSSSTFMVVAVVSYFVLTTFIHNAVFSWTYWFYVIFFFFVPPFYLVWVEYNTWWEILVSAALALVANVVFLAWLHLAVKPQLPYVLNVFPCTWFSVQDTLLMSEKQQAQYEQIRREILEIEEGCAQ